LVSIGGNYYSVPDRTRRVVEVHQLPDQIRILDQGRLVATHSVLEGRRQYRIDPGHRHVAHARMPRQATEDLIIGRIGERVPHRSLAVYQAIGARSDLAPGHPRFVVAHRPYRSDDSGIAERDPGRCRADGCGAVAPFRNERRIVVQLMPLSRCLKLFYWAGYKDRGLIIGFDLDSHLSRLATHWREVKKGANAGAWHLALSGHTATPLRGRPGHTSGGRPSSSVARRPMSSLSSSRAALLIALGSRGAAITVSFSTLQIWRAA
jgi:hypothetical protein